MHIRLVQKNSRRQCPSTFSKQNHCREYFLHIRECVFVPGHAHALCAMQCRVTSCRVTSSYRVSENVYLVMHICCVQWHVAVTCPLRALRRRQPRPCPPRSSFWTEIDSVCLSVFPTDPPPTSVPAARHRCRAFPPGQSSAPPSGTAPGPSFHFRLSPFSF
jgi:hypothetical protein